jgi:hypothetical protein
MITISQLGRLYPRIPVTIIGRYPPRTTKTKSNGKVAIAPDGIPFRFVKVETRDGELIDIEVSHLGGHQPDIDRAVESAPLI